MFICHTIIIIICSPDWCLVSLLQDSEVLHTWLSELHFEEYYPLFIQAAYDMPTISRMTPEVSRITTRRFLQKCAYLRSHVVMCEHDPKQLITTVQCYLSYTGVTDLQCVVFCDAEECLRKLACRNPFNWVFKGGWGAGRKTILLIFQPSHFIVHLLWSVWKNMEKKIRIFFSRGWFPWKWRPYSILRHSPRYT